MKTVMRTKRIVVQVTPREHYVFSLLAGYQRRSVGDVVRLLVSDEAERCGLIGMLTQEEERRGAEQPGGVWPQGDDWLNPFPPRSGLAICLADVKPSYQEIERQLAALKATVGS